MISEPKEYFIKQKLHRGGEEGGVAEDVEDIFGGGDEESLSLFDMNAVDMRFSPEADYYDESVGMQIDLRRHLHHYPVHREIGAVNEFGVRFGGIIGSAVLGPNLIVDRLFRLGDMQFARVTMRIFSSEIIDAIGDIRGLLDLGEEVTGSDGVQSSGREEEEVSLV